MKYLNKKFIILLVFAVVLVGLGRNLNPFNDIFFEAGHDETQVVRVLEFVSNLRVLNIPPRLAPNLSFGMGYPVFNFYAPSAYWIAGIIDLVTIDAVLALKWAYLLTVLVGFASIYFLLKEDFDWQAAILGASLYVSALYWALDIFVRNNLAETWLLALMPVTLWLIRRNCLATKKWQWVATILVYSLTFTAHNLLSPIWLVVLITYTFTLKNRLKNLLTLGLSILLSAYFFVPLIFESGFIHLSEVATKTDYRNHFLCWGQLWKSPWGYGGSDPGCTDGMSFMVGKPQLSLALAGIIVGVFQLFRKKSRVSKKWLGAILVSSVSLFMTTYLSKPIWELFNPILSYIQFPWRMISFSLIGLIWLAAFFWDQFKFVGKGVVTLVVIGAVVSINGKYFTAPDMKHGEYLDRFASIEQMQTKTAYQMPEYLPKVVDYAAWNVYHPDRKFKQSLSPHEYGTGQFQIEKFIISPQKVTLPVHYFPFWKIKVNGVMWQPDTFDSLGRPVIEMVKPGTIELYYSQTLIERLGNAISLLTFLALGIVLLTEVFARRKKI